MRTSRAGFGGPRQAELECSLIGRSGRCGKRTRAWSIRRRGTIAAWRHSGSPVAGWPTKPEQGRGDGGPSIPDTLLVLGVSARLVGHGEPGSHHHRGRARSARVSADSAIPPANSTGRPCASTRAHCRNSARDPPASATAAANFACGSEGPVPVVRRDRLLRDDRQVAVRVVAGRVALSVACRRPGAIDAIMSESAQRRVVEIHRGREIVDSDRHVVQHEAQPSRSDSLSTTEIALAIPRLTLTKSPTHPDEIPDSRAAAGGVWWVTLGAGVVLRGKAFRLCSPGPRGIIEHAMPESGHDNLRHAFRNRVK